ncbi:MAG TPA: homoserine kinase [Acidimicrobiia bacterium]
MRAFRVRVPASSANLGAGFDTLGLALSLYLDLQVGSPGPHGSGGDGDGDGGNRDGPAWTSDEHHLAIRTFRAAGGDGPVAARAQFAGGRGLGFSGAARVAGVFAAATQRGASVDEARTEAATRASELESHGDNASASALGGLVAVAGTHAVRVPVCLANAIVVWVPDTETSTKTSRGLLPDTVPFADAVSNVGHAALFVAAMAAGDVGALRTASEDHLHQQRRLDRAPASRAALLALEDAGAWCAWLSGSGPTVAALCAPDDAADLVAALPPGGRGIVCSIDDEGVRVT